ncbi:polysaccharide pyruvyl transferase family protein [Fibrobacter intestinalis]|uniref:polysaccharide pyruvyl transferase family protein n=1 Tax=Fibrobacter intestinalis TaxID=28122 RepID=UPI0013563968|nr:MULTISPECIES: polysaccharide pyruvyl transferase family protein [Fibrobacter]
MRQGKVFVNPPVEDFLSLLANASYVITDSFHATAFSINFGRDFFVFYPGLFSSRLSSVLELVGAKERALSEPKDVEKFLDRTLDYSGIHNALQKARNESMDFLKMALEKANEVAYRN